MRIDFEDQVVQEYLNHDSDRLEGIVWESMVGIDGKIPDYLQNVSFPFLDFMQTSILEAIAFIQEENVGGPMIEDIKQGIQNLSLASQKMAQEEVSPQQEAELTIEVFRSMRLMFNRATSLASHFANQKKG